MTTATLLGKYTLPINIPLEAEDNKPKAKRSYIHYLAEHQPLVAAKVAATDWLLRNAGLSLDQRYTSREYLAGVGIQTILIDSIFDIVNQSLSEVDPRCVEQLASVAWEVPTIIQQQDVVTALKEPDNSDLVFLDFPSSSALTRKTKWAGFDTVFERKPQLVVFTDTAIVYPVSIHGKRYQAALGVDYEIKTETDYLRAISDQLWRDHGYTVAAAAFRERNAVYLAARPGDHETLVARFKATDHANCFTLD